MGDSSAGAFSQGGCRLRDRKLIYTRADSIAGAIECCVTLLYIQIGPEALVVLARGAEAES